MADTYEPSDLSNPENSKNSFRPSRDDTEAFRQIHRDHNPRVFAFAARLLDGDAWAAADVTQETFLRLWRNRHMYREEGALHAYLLRIAYNLCQDARRARRPQVDLETCADVAADTPGVDDAVLAASLSDAVLQAVTRLPERQRMVFVLSHYEQLSYREIADALNCPIGTVASRKYLAVEALRKSLRHWMPAKD